MPNEHTYPLTPLQQGMLTRNILDGNEYYEVQQITCSFNERLNIQHMTAAWNKVISSFDVLHTKFITNESELYQTIEPNVDISIERITLKPSKETALQNELEQFVLADREKGINIHKSPITRVTIIDVAEENSVLLWTFHHALLDGTSYLLIIEYVLSYYDRLQREQIGVLPKSYPFREYVHYLNNQSEMEKIAQEDYWVKYLADLDFRSRITDVLNFKEASKAKVRNIHTYLSKKLSDRIRAVAKNYKVRTNNIFQLAWSILLHKYLGEEDIVFGVTTASRHVPLSEMKKRVGLFINTLPIKVKIDDSKKIHNLLDKILSDQIKHRQFEQISYNLLHDYSGLSKAVPLFESVIIFNRTHPNTHWKTLGSSWETRDFNKYGISSFPLTLYIYDDSEIDIELAYDLARLSSDSANHLLQHFENILKQLVLDTSTLASDICLLSEQEKQNFIDDNSATEKEELCSEMLHDKFDLMALKYPNNDAIIFNGCRVSYKELNNRASILAIQLQNKGIVAGSLVGVAVSRGVGMVVSLLAILKTGAGYVPMDPTYPAERIKYIYENSKANLVMTNLPQLALFDENAIPKLIIDIEGVCIEEMNESSSSFMEVEIDDRNSAYVIFTSGSTGKPKGVQVSHKSVVNFIDSMIETPGITNKDILLAVTTLSFDIHVLELFCPLSVGATLVICDEIQAKNGWELSNLISNNSVTILQATPMTWRLLMASGWSGQIKGLVGGEAFPIDLLGKLCRSGVEVWNMYGPTETTVWSTCAKLENANMPITIGYPINNTQVYVTDSFLNILPYGIAGELVIGGVGVSKGYIGDEQQTNASFVKDTISYTNRLLYKTGDIVIQDKDGSIRYLNRKDSQVKLRGFRIELQEIEAQISSFSAVKECAVIIVKQENSDVLVGYVCLNEKTEHLEEKIRDILSKKLPDYMIPSIIIELSEIPLTNNGKIDKKSLPKPQTFAFKNNANNRPLSQNEEMLVGIWKEILKLDEIGIDDDFISLGGDSLAAMQVMFKLSQHDIPDELCKGIFKGETIRDMAKKLEDDSDIAKDKNIKPIEGKIVTRTSVNLLRALLVILVVAAHWSYGLFERLPSSFEFIQEMLMPLFTIITPGFAITFGITMGYIYFPIYKVNKERAHKTFITGSLILFMAITLQSVLILTITWIKGDSFNTTVIFNSLYSALSYYFLAMLTVRYWFNIISLTKYYIVNCLALVFVMFFLSLFFDFYIGNNEYAGFVQLLKLMLTAKFNYFSMSAFAMLGIAIGILLAKGDEKNQSYKLFIQIALCLIAISLVLNYFEGKNQHNLSYESLALFAGIISMLIYTITKIITRKNFYPQIVRNTINWIEMIGLAALPIWILHHLVLHVKTLLDFVVIDVIGLIIILIIFFSITYKIVKRLHRFYY